jgi:hypothetical protein
LPDYEQPPCPEDGYLWTPGYWNYGAVGYYWVPGTWVQPPSVGVLWTPGYWGFAGGIYGFHVGYWGPHIGFYGGVNYGFGYGGVGFVGGRWDGGHYHYNTAITNVNVTVIHNTYNQTVINNNTTVNRVSFNGVGGVRAVATVQERTYTHEPHIPPTTAQVQHIQSASSNPALSVRANAGHPAIAATAKPGAFTGPGVVGAHGATPIRPGAPGGNTFGGAGAAGMHGNTPPGGQPNNFHPPAAGQPNAFHAPAGTQPPANQSNIVHPPVNGGARPPVTQMKATPPPPKAPPPKASPPPKKPPPNEKEKP